MAASVVFGLSGAFAQENLDAGKTGAQLFASDCVLCHKTPQGLAKGGPLSGLSGFLREHYTASRETAAVLAAYLQSVGAAPEPRGRRPAASRRAAPAAKPGEAAGAAKVGDKAGDKAGEAGGHVRPAAAASGASAQPAAAKPAAEESPAEKPAEKSAEPAAEKKPPAETPAGGTTEKKE